MAFCAIVSGCQEIFPTVASNPPSAHFRSMRQEPSPRIYNYKADEKTPVRIGPNKLSVLNYKQVGTQGERKSNASKYVFPRFRHNLARWILVNCVNVFRPIFSNHSLLSPAILLHRKALSHVTIRQFDRRFFTESSHRNTSEYSFASGQSTDISRGGLSSRPASNRRLAFTRVSTHVTHLPGGKVDPKCASVELRSRPAARATLCPP